MKKTHPLTDLDADIREHIDRETEDNVERGMSQEDARYAALRKFGNATLVKENARAIWIPRWCDQVWQDARVGARSLLRYPVACLVAVLSLAAGIGATTATLTIRDVVFHKPPALYHEPAQLSRVQIGSPEHPIMPTGNPVPGRLFAAWRGAPIGATLAGAALPRVREIRTGDRIDTARVRLITPDFFSVLGVEPIIGRTSGEQSASALLSYRVWQTLFDGRLDAIGSTLWIDGQPFTVAGVMPQRFWFSTMDTPIWTPVSINTLAAEAGVEVVARRQLGVSPEGFAEQLANGLNAYATSLPAPERQLRLKVSGVEGTPLGRSVALALPWLLGVCVLLTLLIACANVATLVIAQWTAREQEIAIRASLGASRSRIIRTLVTESALIAGIGGVLGVGATFALRGVIVHRGGSGFQMFDLTVNPRILFESFVITTLCGLAAGIGPAVLETRRLQGNPMRALAPSDRVRQRWRHALVVLEIAVTVALLVVTGGLLNTYAQQLTRDIGFNTHPLVRLRVENTAGVPVGRIIDAVAQIPGVAAVAPSTTIPYFAYGPLEGVSADRSGSRSLRAERAAIGRNFFATLDIPLRAGRMFNSGDSSGTRTAIINEWLAARLFQGQDPIGQRLWLRGDPYEIVGVVTQYFNAALQPHERDPKVYVPLTESASVTEMEFLIRASADPGLLVNTLRQRVRNIAAGTVATNVNTIDEVVAIGGQEILVGTAPMLPLIATGMLLTAAGIYGVLAFAVARRSKELAVRIAIGATGRQVVRLVTMQSLHLTGIGIAVGVGATFAMSRIVRASGGEGSFMDPTWPAFVIPVAIIGVIVTVATFVPSRRALRIDPASVLRTQ
jgi:putative ABC transport system permease protein